MGKPGTMIFERGMKVRVTVGPHVTDAEGTVVGHGYLERSPHRIEPVYLVELDRDYRTAIQGQGNRQPMVLSTIVASMENVTPW